jgi:hypothetical protein
MIAPIFSIHRPHHQDVEWSEGMTNAEYILKVKQKIVGLALSTNDKIRELERFQLWILEHFYVVLDVYAPEYTYDD